MQSTLQQPALLTPLDLRADNYVFWNPAPGEGNTLLQVINVRLVPTELIVKSGDYVIDGITNGYEVIADIRFTELRPFVLSPGVMKSLGFTECPCGRISSSVDNVYTRPGCDASTEWIVAFDGEHQFLWLMIDKEERCIAELYGLHHLANLLYDLDRIVLDFIVTTKQQLDHEHESARK